MAIETTCALIKPTAVARGASDLILDMITANGFEIVAMKKRQLSLEEAGEFYAVHKNKYFFKPLIAFMTSGPIITLVLKKENAIQEFRTLMGVKEIEHAAEGTIRKRFAHSMRENAVHGSDSKENAALEIKILFAEKELL